MFASGSAGIIEAAVGFETGLSGATEQKAGVSNCDQAKPTSFGKTKTLLIKRVSSVEERWYFFAIVPYPTYRDWME
jgi:hypothetical protein